MRLVDSTERVDGRQKAAIDKFFLSVTHKKNRLPDFRSPSTSAVAADHTLLVRVVIALELSILLELFRR